VGYSHVRPGPEAVGHLGLGAEQCGCEHHLVRDGRSGVVPATGQPEGLGLGSHLGVALTGVGLVVEVGGRRSHASEAEGEAGLSTLDHLVQLGLVPGEGDLGALAEVQVGQGATRPGGTSGKGIHRGLCALGNEAGSQPAIGHLSGEGEHAWGKRGDVDGQRLVCRPERESQGLSLAPGKGQPHLFALQDQPLAGLGEADHLDGLAHAGERSGEGHAVESLDHLGAGRPEPQDESAAGDPLQREGGHGGVGSRARPDLEHAGPEDHPVGVLREGGDGGCGVSSPGFGDPAVVDAESLGLGHVGDEIRPRPGTDCQLDCRTHTDQSSRESRYGTRTACTGGGSDPSPAMTASRSAASARGATTRLIDRNGYRSLPTRSRAFR